MNENLSQSYKDFFAVPLGEHAAQWEKDLRRFMETASAPMKALGGMEIPAAMRENLPPDEFKDCPPDSGAHRYFKDRWAVHWNRFVLGQHYVGKLNFDSSPVPSFSEFYRFGCVVECSAEVLIRDLSECYYFEATPKDQHDFSLDACDSRFLNEPQWNYCWDYKIAGVTLSDIEWAAMGVVGMFLGSDFKTLHDAILSGDAHNERAEIVRLQKTVRSREVVEASLQQLLQLEYATPRHFAHHFTLDFNLAKPMQSQRIRAQLRENIGPHFITGTDITYAAVCTTGAGTNWRVPQCLIRKVCTKLRQHLRE